MLTAFTGRPYLLMPALISMAREALDATDAELYVIVPKQLTLQTELSLINGLNLIGSFRLQVLSPERLCSRIFEAAGKPEGVRVDERGRAMLTRRVLNALGSELTVYRDSQKRRGFSHKLSKQLEIFRQSGLTSAQLSELSKARTGLAAGKLTELSLVLNEYERLMTSRYQDGELEFQLAGERLADAGFLKTARLIFYGFDLMPPCLQEFVIALSDHAETSILLPLDIDIKARDADVFRPLISSLARLKRMSRAKNVMLNTARLSDAPCSDIASLAFLERELFAFPPRDLRENLERVHVMRLASPRAEAEYAASVCRRLAMQGCRFSDIVILARDITAYAGYLTQAFSTFGVPMFVSDSRKTARHALCECLLTAIRIAGGRTDAEDISALIETGFWDMERGDAESVINYAYEFSISGYMLFRPLSRGSAERREAMQPLFDMLAAPLVKLRDELRKAKDLRAQLVAVYGFLESIGAYEKCLQRQEAFMESGNFEQANAEGQVWNRVINALSQMDAMLGERRLSVRELADTLTDALEVKEIKPLPQSGDAVHAQGLDRACERRAKVVVFIGMTDGAASGADGILSPAMQRDIEKATGAYLGAKPEDTALMTRYYIKCAIGMAIERVIFTYPTSGANGSATRPAPVIGLIAAMGDTEPFLGAISAEAALNELALSIGAGESPKWLPELMRIMPDKLIALKKALARPHVEALSQPSAKELFGMIERASVTRLELFAACPYKHFLRYGLAPIIIEPYSYTPRDEGNFFHDALNEFLRRAGADIADMPPEKAAENMRSIADSLLIELADTALTATAVDKAEIRRLIASVEVAARALTRQFKGSAFTPVELEMKFGGADEPERDSISLNVEGGCVLTGYIDRVDEFTHDDEKYLRVIDYKRGANTLDLAAMYSGARLQLLTYLASAMKRRGGLSAGAYYFRVSEGIVPEQSTDINVIEAQRRKLTRLTGLMPDDIGLLRAMTTQPEDVLGVRINKDGTLRKGEPATDQEGFNALIKRTLDMAGEHVTSIRSGTAEASPLRSEKYDPCRFCAYANACISENVKPRKQPNIDNSEVLKLLKFDNNGHEIEKE